MGVGNDEHAGAEVTTQGSNTQLSRLPPLSRLDNAPAHPSEMRFDRPALSTTARALLTIWSFTVLPSTTTVRYL